MISEIRRQFPKLTNINPVRISGGQKEVFQAVLNGEDVALKLVKVYASDQIRTEREIAAVTKLNSDYVPKIYQTGRCVILSEDRYFIIEQYIHGVPHPVFWTQVFLKPPSRLRLERAIGPWPARG